jgi:hypothetical protein
MRNSVRFRAVAIAAIAASALVVGVAAPASAMHNTPAPVGDMAPSFSGHYRTPDVGQHGAARPWVAGPSWNR